MAKSNNSGPATPDNSRFTSSVNTIEDRLQADTVGLVQLSDFRKRRAEALEAAQDGSGSVSRSSTPDTREQAAQIAFKKRKKGGVKKAVLSFGDEEEDEDTNLAPSATSRSKTPATDTEGPSDGKSTTFKKRGLKPNAAVSLQPKALTKSALLREAQLKETLRKEYLQIQEAVKATEFVIPFVFYDGKNIPGGSCRVKKGDFIWLFLDRARKLGAGLEGKGDRSRKDWARIGVDDLMLVKGDLIIPHHYDFHYFIVNRTTGYQGVLFDYASEPTSATPQHLVQPTSTTTPADSQEAESHLTTATQRKQQAAMQSGPPDSELEGFNDDANRTRVVDRRWYEKNKHIFPASNWEEFDVTKNYSTDARKDAQGNAMFFSR